MFINEHEKASAAEFFIPAQNHTSKGLAINSRVEVTLKLDRKRESAIKAFGAWSEKNDIEDGDEYPFITKEDIQAVLLYASKAISMEEEVLVA